MHARTRLAALAAAVVLPLALGCGSGSPTTKPMDKGEYERKMQEGMQKEMMGRKGAGMATPTDKGK